MNENLKTIIVGGILVSGIAFGGIYGHNNAVKLCVRDKCESMSKAEYKELKLNLEDKVFKQKNATWNEIETMIEIIKYEKLELKNVKL